MSFSQERQLHRCCCWLIHYRISITIDTITIQNYTNYNSPGTPTAHNQRLAQDHPNDWWYPTCTCLHVECRRRESAQVPGYLALGTPEVHFSARYYVRTTRLVVPRPPVPTHTSYIHKEPPTNFSTLNKNTHNHIQK